jgi:hypothetical protein
MDFFGQIRPSAPATLFPELTVRNHVSTILSKLQAVDRAEAAQQARNAGL